MSKAIFLVGAPGSGKDLLLRSVLGEHTLVEISLDKLSVAIQNHQELPEVDSLSSLVVNGNADRISAVSQARSVLEAMGYETSLLYVFTTNEASKARNDARIARGAKTFTESQRQQKYSESVKCLDTYSKSFSPFWLFNNSEEVNLVSEQFDSWVIELGEEVSNWLGEGQEFDSKAHYNHVKHPTQVPSAPVQHTSAIKGFERVKDVTGRYVLRRKPATESTKYNTSLNRAFETYTATAVDNSRGNTRVTDNGSPTENPATVMAKVLKSPKKTPGDQQGGIASSSKNMAEPPTVEATSVDQKVKAPTQKRMNKKNTKTQGATPPPDFFDSKMGGVPSGSLGLTSSYVPVGKSLSEIRKNLEPSKMEHHEAELRKKRIAAQLKGDVETAKRLEDEIDKLNPAAAARMKNIKKADRARKPNKTWGR